MQHAAEQGVVVNYDAEQFHLQPVIDTLVLDSMRRFNHTTANVLNTYQCYLKVCTHRRPTSVGDVDSSLKYAVCKRNQILAGN